MKQSTKMVLVALISLLAGAGIFYGVIKYQALQEENKRLKEKSAVMVTAEPTPAAAMTAAPTAKQMQEKKEETGQIEGVVGYPAEGIPPLTVYAIKTDNPSVYFSVDTAQNQGTFTITAVVPGTYYVLAYAKSYSTVGGYTKAVACGLSVDCKDHSLIPVNVTAGQTSKGVEVKDYYAPEGTFPSKPK